MYEQLDNMLIGDTQTADDFVEASEGLKTYGNWQTSKMQMVNES